jgi:hypothetical protein
VLTTCARSSLPETLFHALAHRLRHVEPSVEHIFDQGFPLALTERAVAVGIIFLDDLLPVEGPTRAIRPTRWLGQHGRSQTTNQGKGTQNSCTRDPLHDVCSDTRRCTRGGQGRNQGELTLEYANPLPLAAQILATRTSVHPLVIRKSGVNGQ